MTAAISALAAFLAFWFQLSAFPRVPASTLPRPAQPVVLPGRPRASTLPTSTRMFVQPFLGSAKAASRSPSPATSPSGPRPPSMRSDSRPTWWRLPSAGACTSRHQPSSYVWRRRRAFLPLRSPTSVTGWTTTCCRPALPGCGPCLCGEDRGGISTPPGLSTLRPTRASKGSTSCQRSSGLRLVSGHQDRTCESRCQDEREPSVIGLATRKTSSGGSPRQMRLTAAAVKLICCHWAASVSSSIRASPAL